MLSRFLLVLFLVFFVSSLSLAQSYSRGPATCEDFKVAEFSYKYSPDSVHSQMGYAECLILKGEDAKGLGMLQHLVEQHNEVNAAFTLAWYIQTGGKFVGLDKHKVDEAISAYERVLFLIEIDPHYPKNGNVIYESEIQMELNSQYSVALLFLKKFQFGASETHEKYLLQSPSYEGDRGENRYPQYGPYTVDSLQKMRKFGHRCASLPKRPYFQEKTYRELTKACGIIRDTAKTLLPLEEKRLTLLFQESCHKDLPKCSEYNAVVDEQVNILNQNIRKINDTLTDGVPI